MPATAVVLSCTTSPTLPDAVSATAIFLPRAASSPAGPVSTDRRAYELGGDRRPGEVDEGRGQCATVDIRGWGGPGGTKDPGSYRAGAQEDATECQTETENPAAAESSGPGKA